MRWRRCSIGCSAMRWRAMPGIWNCGCRPDGSEHERNCCAERRHASLTVRRGERIVICGPSGGGKSTLIRCINAIERHQRGRIVVNGVELTSDLKRIDEVRREVGMVFQQFNLFPHLSVLENCTLAPIWVRKLPKAQAEE